jgi:hypothetical protein
MDSYCFGYSQFCQTIKSNLTQQPILANWLKPLIDDGIILNWLISLNDPKAKRIIDIIKDGQFSSKPTEAIIKRVCLELELE